MKELGCRLFSPQAHFAQNVSKGECGIKRKKYSMEVFYDSVTLRLGDQSPLTIPYDPVSFLPIVQGFTSVKKSCDLLALLGGVTAERNQNLTYLMKLLLRWHIRLGHIDFSVVKWIGRQGWLGKMCEQMGRHSVKIPKCAACQYGKQERNTKEGSTQVKWKDKEGVLKKNKLEPGDLVFTDQFESRIPGMVFSDRGTRVTVNTYKGGTLFVDAATTRVKTFCQSSFTAEETIQSKLTFEKQSFGEGVAIKAYSSDNGVYQARDYMNELLKKGQGIKRSGVGGHHHNGVAENSIKNITRIARTMMINAALRWPEVAEKKLWPLAFQHAIHVHNNTPNVQTGLTPEELWTKSKGTNSAVRNAHTWGCPVYILDPRAQDGGKLPKWIPRSRQGQYVGVSSLHASTVGLVKNFRTGNLSPQFHVVYDDFFETVVSTPEEEPAIWQELLVFNRFQSDYDPEEYTPGLTDDWLGPDEVRDDQPNTMENLRTDQREPVRQNPGVEAFPPINDESRNLGQAERESDRTPSDMNETQTSSGGGEAGAQRYPSRLRKPPTMFTFDKEHVYLGSLQRLLSNIFMWEEEKTREEPGQQKCVVQDKKNKVRPGMPKLKGANSEKVKDIKRHVYSQAIRRPSNLSYVAALLLNADYGLVDTLLPQMLGDGMGAFKANKMNDPDTPQLNDALTGPYRQEFLDAMRNEIVQLEHHKTWRVVPKGNVHAGTKILPSTWALKIKHYPDGRLRKFKARFCVRGDCQTEGIDYFDKYAPVVSWSTVRLLSIMSISQGWVSRQVDFSNAFVQAPLNEEIYVNLPRLFCQAEGADKHVLKLNRSLYGLVQAPLYWYNYLKERLNTAGLLPSKYDPCLSYGEDVICLTYVDDCIFFAKNYEAIDRVLQKLKDQKLDFTVEEDVHAFLGVEIDKRSDGSVEMTQKGLIKKILKTTGMEDCNAKSTPANVAPLGTDAQGKPFDEKWEYASVMGMLLYLSSNTRIDIQFAVHQCARFTHVPKASHAEAIKRICRYLKGTLDKGVIMKPGTDPKLDCYADADFAGLWNVESDQDPVCVKSRTGYVIMFASCPVTWVSKLQSEISLSTLEAEYIALSQAMRDFLPMRELLKEISSKTNLTANDIGTMHSTVFEDNNGALGLATSPRITPRTKHIAIKYHFFRDKIGVSKGITIEHVESELQMADCLTKRLVEAKFTKLRLLLQGW